MNETPNLPVKQSLQGYKRLKQKRVGKNGGECSVVHRGGKRKKRGDTASSVGHKKRKNRGNRGLK